MPQRRNSGRSGRSSDGRRRGRGSNGTNPAPFVIGGAVIVLGLVLIMAFKGNGNDEEAPEAPNENGRAAAGSGATKSSETPKAAAKKTTSSSATAEKDKWRALAKQLDTSRWTAKIEPAMAKALAARKEAKAAHKAGDMATFKAKATVFMKHYDEAGNELDELISKADLIHRDLWQMWFKSYNRKWSNWTRMMREYMSYRQ